MLERVSPKEADAPVTGWRRERGRPSLSEVFGSIRTRPKGPYLAKLLAFLGPGYLVATGYMDPGNWATSLAGGSKFGYALLTIALLSNMMAILLQACVRASVSPRGAISRKHAVTHFRVSSRCRCGSWRRSRFARPTLPKSSVPRSVSIFCSAFRSKLAF